MKVVLTRLMMLDWDLCYAVNVKAHVFLMREALASFNSNQDGGAFIITSSIAGRIPVSQNLAHAFLFW